MKLLTNFFHSKVFLGLVIGAILLSIAYAIILAGSPAKQRARELDQQRIGDLQQISYAVGEYWRRNTKLPNVLTDLNTMEDIYIGRITDPVTGEPYEYRAVGERKYELCATFQEKSYENVGRKPSQDPWEHEVGRACFQREVFVNPLDKGIIPIPPPVM